MKEGLLEAPTDFDVTGEEELVAKAKQGDRDAFGELVSRSRMKALGLATTITKDTYLAEDIVQDGLIRAFLKIGDLVDNRRFQPWLHKIIKNEAYMKLRKGTYQKEKPVTSFTSENGATNGGSNGIDSILDRLIDRIPNSNETADPLQHCVRKELLKTIQNLMGCLSEKERNIFEAFFFEQLSPREIAALFQITSNNVYNTIYKTKIKIRKERIRIQINDFVMRRREEGKPVRKILSKPSTFKR